MAKRKSSVTPEEKEKFEQFLFEMDNVLEPFVEAAGAKGFVLDYSIDSLAALEQYWRAAGDGQRAGTDVNRAARYLGEVFRRVVGGVWRLCDKGPRYLYHGLPAICGYAATGIEFCPNEVFGNFIVRGESGLLQRAVESHLEFRAE
jgi:hypothetical protein